MSNELYVSRAITAPSGFTAGIEGPACDQAGNLYAVEFERSHTIGRVTPEGECSVYVELPDGSTASGIRFNRAGDMFIADYSGHNILKVAAGTKHISVYAHEPTMNQPNDIAITNDGTLFASDPNWQQSTGNLWRIDLDGKTTLLEENMGTTNGIEVSPDEKTLYVNETIQRNIWAYDLSPSYEISNKRLLISFPDFGLDGMRCDVSGNLYATRIGKGCIAMISPSGELLREIQLIGKNCTNITFGGPDGRTCYVTISDHGNIEMFRSELPGRCWSMTANQNYM